MYRRIEKLTICLAVGLALVAIGYAGFGSRLNAVPEPVSFLGEFFRAPFAVIVCSFIGWYIAMRRKTPARLAVYLLLNSLPISSREILLRFIFLDLLKYGWLLIIEIVVFLGVAQVAPLAHLLRLSIVALLAYSAAIVANATMQISFAVWHRHAGGWSFPVQNNTAISLSVVVLHAIIVVQATTSAEMSSGAAFWVLSAALSSIAIVMLILGERLFKTWRDKNVACSHSPQIAEASQKTIPILAGRLDLVLQKNPLLAKNLIKISREKQAVPASLTAAFAMLAYLIAMNNASTSARVTVLFALTVIYACLFSYRVIAQTSDEQEPRKLLYALPVSRTAFYAAFFVPALCQLAIVVSGLTLLLAFSIDSFQTAVFFWLNSIAAISMLLAVALNFGAAGYPDAQRAQQRYLYWILSAVALTAVFYRFHWIVITLMVVMTFRPLRKIRFYELSRIAGKFDHFVLR